MPEGPEVATVADALQAKLGGATLNRIQVTERSRYYENGLVGLETLELPVKISHIGSIGKRIVFYLVYGEEGRPAYLVSFLGMEGKWLYEPGNHSGIQLSITLPETQEDLELYFDDTRHFGSLVICMDVASWRRAMVGVGPDLLKDNIDSGEYIRVLSQPRLRNKLVGCFLLEQKYFSGIGNYLRAEILYAARISPWRTLESLDDRLRHRLFVHSRRIIQEAYEAHGLTISSYRDPDGRRGSYDVKVYMRTTDPLGNPVIREDLGDKRMMHWVPNVQL